MEVWVGCPGVRKGLVMGAREIEGFLERWQLDVLRRMYLVPTPRDRERWHALWLLARGVDRLRNWGGLGPGPDPHTIGRWLSAFVNGGAKAVIFEQSGGSPRPRRGVASVTEGGGAGVARHGGHGTGQLELEGGPSVCLGTVGHQPEPQQLPELPAPFGIRPEASQEAAGQG